VLPLTFADPGDYDGVGQGDELVIRDVVARIRDGADVTVENRTTGAEFRCAHDLSPRQVELVTAGSLITFLRDRVNPS
jgi:aconitate hydratase